MNRRFYAIEYIDVITNEIVHLDAGYDSIEECERHVNGRWRGYTFVVLVEWHGGEDGEWNIIELVCEI